MSSYAEDSLERETKRERKELKPFIERNNAGVSNIVNQLIKRKEQFDASFLNNTQPDLSRYSPNRPIPNLFENNAANESYKESQEKSGANSFRTAVKNHYLNTEKGENSYSYLMKTRTAYVNQEYVLLRDGVNEASK